jgi:hypothetical protein
MLRGHLDSFTTSGYVEGWAFDSESPARPIEIGVDRDAVEVAWGLAHRFRADLAAAQCGTGWCAFRVRVEGSPRRLCTGVLVLVDRGSRQELHRVTNVPLLDDGEAPIASVEQLIESDPTALKDVDQLRGCESLFVTFIRDHGVDAFVCAVYVYVLGRPADDGGLARYARCIREASLSPFHLFEALSQSDEFRSRRRMLTAPSSSAFPFV